jgi:D-lactate dehydrogenase (cytochrome)
MEALNHYINPSAPASSSNYRAHYPITDTLFIKIQGNPASIKETSTVAQAILAKHRCTGLRFANGKEEADEMWGHRREALLAILSYIEGSSAWTTDVWYVLTAVHKGT